MTTIDITQTIVIIGLVAVILWDYLRRPTRTDDALANLQSHNRAIAQLLETEKGKQLLVEYTLNEAALAGAFDFIFKRRTEEIRPDKIATSLPDKMELAAEGSKKKGFWSILLQKLNGILKGVSFGILGGGSEDA